MGNEITIKETIMFDEETSLSNEDKVLKEEKN